MRQKLLRILLIVLLVAFNIGCDQVTKITARNSLRGKGTVSVFGDFFVLHYVENEGAFLSFGSQWPELAQRLLLTVGPGIVVLALLVYILRSSTLRTAQLVAYSFIIGGGISNIIDRIVFDGKVTDFMNLGIGKVRTGIFNFADLSVLAGVIILLFTLWTGKRKSGVGGDTA